jgi:sigma-E factor negative regulatory protein RseC
MKLSSDPGIIEHAGIVQENNEKTVTVKISPRSACSGCEAERSCSLSGREEKIIEIAGSSEVKPGDQVTVIMKKSAGYTAVFLSYIVPLLLMVTILVVMIGLSASELAAGLVSILALVPYFGLIRMFSKRLNKQFSFEIRI